MDSELDCLTNELEATWIYAWIQNSWVHALHLVTSISIIGNFIHSSVT